MTRLPDVVLRVPVDDVVMLMGACLLVLQNHKSTEDIKNWAHETIDQLSLELEVQHPIQFGTAT